MNQRRADLSRVRSGLEVILDSRLDLLEGSRVGVIANPSSVDSGLNHIVDLFHRHPDIRLTTVMGPQHGARGETQDNMIEWEDYRDSVTGLPVYSLYGVTRKPTPEMLAGLDVLVFDVQDVGCRIYTFVYTMALAMQACRENGKKLIVLDRPNPINGLSLEGPVLDPAFASFVGLYPLPIRHGLTVGELALYFNDIGGIGCELEVVRMENWHRDMYFEDTGLPWVFPSPNIPIVESAVVFPGTVPLEGTNVSEGRGTTRPFELSGAPWIEPRVLVERLQETALEGVTFRPAHFIPTFHKWSGRIISGVQIHVQDRDLFHPVRTGLALLLLYRELGGSQFKWNPPPYEYEYEKLPIDLIVGTDSVRLLIEKGAGLADLEQSWQTRLSEFETVRHKYLLY